MPLLETLMIDLGGSIAKALLSRWLSDNTIVSDASSSIVDVLKNSVTDRLAQQRARHQLEVIGNKVGENLLPVFEMEGAALDEGSRTAIALAVSETLNTATPSLLARHDLEPVEIAQHLLADHPARSYHFSDTEGRLYEQIVGECCQYIVDIASQLPQFTERTFAEILTRERYLVEIADRIVKDIARLRAQLNPQVEAARFELDYRLTVIRKLDELELFGSDMSVTARKYSLGLAYVSLSLEHEIPQPVHEEQDKIDMAVAMFKGKPQLVRTVADFASVLAESPYLLLRGDAGSGKTTLMQWIAVQSASKTCSPVLATWNDTIPFFIRLRQHVRLDQDGEPRWPAPESFPGLVAPAIAGAMPPGWVHRQLQEGRALVLVDGIDEVPAPLRPGVYAWLGDLITTYPEARFIVTARPYAASKEDLPVRERLKEAQVLPMTPSAIDEFILQWHRAVAANVQDIQEKQELQEIADHLIAKINSKTNQTLQQLARNPLLCAMLCALNRERHQQLPPSRIALYEACCELLIERRDRERRISLADYPAAALSYEQKSLLLSHLAYWLIRNGQTEEAIETIDERLKHSLSRMVGVSQDLQGSDARRLFIERSGILREPVKGAIDFTHRTFQEFLAAKAIVDEDDISFLVDNSHNDQWHEVVLLTVGLAPRAMREKLVERLLK
ncbi:MAG TPA: NACHT domain-containing protein, partial [Ktedonobacteraceae bacterium]|nr:NACHT domain-containing protein [Ktedonobacteraceae bacterium]